MLVLLSPAKKQNFNCNLPTCQFTKPQSLSDIKLLITELKKHKPAKLSKLMSISKSLADLNYERFQAFNPNKFDTNNAAPAVFAFQGDAYQSLNINDFNKQELNFIQNHLLILSGLYGYLRPLDLIQAYRLEMKTPLKNPRGKDLYQFWGNKITQAINKAIKIHNHKTIINLASNEYFKAINPDKLSGNLVSVQFKEKKNGQFKTIGINAKRARGAMTRFIMKNKLDDVNDISKFKENKYTFNKKLSSENVMIFTR